MGSCQLDIRTAVAGEPAAERLIRALDTLTPKQMETVAAAWHQMPRQHREAAWDVVRGIWRSTASDDGLDQAFRARRAASRLARLAGAHDWAFPAAALDAALAVAVAGQLGDRHYRPLVRPMAQALPWLLEQPPAADIQRTVA